MPKVMEGSREKGTMKRCREAGLGEAFSFKK